jgi:hypothetical protein
VIQRSALFGAVVLVAAAWPTALGQPPLRNIYVVTQAYCLEPQLEPDGKCHPQSVPVGKTLEVQLPGTPSVWTVESPPNQFEFLRRKKLPSPDRVEGTSDIYIFTFKVGLPQGSVDLVFKETPPLLSKFSKPVGKFTFRVTVK